MQLFFNIIRRQLLKQMLILHNMVCQFELINLKLLYISLLICVLRPVCSPHSLLFPNTTSISTKEVESALLPYSLSRSDSLITWPNTPPRQSANLSPRSSSDTLDNFLESPHRDNQFPLPCLSPRSPPRSPLRSTSRVPKGGIGAAAGSRPSRRPFKNSDGQENSKRKTTMSDFIRLKRSNNFPF